MLIPRCDDGIQSGSETGIDCGGIHCITCGKKFSFILIIYFLCEKQYEDIDNKLMHIFDESKCKMKTSDYKVEKRFHSLCYRIQGDS